MIITHGGDLPVIVYIFTKFIICFLLQLYNHAPRFDTINWIRNVKLSTRRRPWYLLSPPQDDDGGTLQLDE